MAQRVRDILLRIRGDASDAERELHDLAREVKAFGQIDAEATVDVNTQAAQRELAAAGDAVRAFGRLTAEAKVDLQTRAAQVKLDGLNRNLENLQKRPTSPKVDLAIGATVAKIERVEQALDKLERRRVDVNVDVDRRGGGRVLGGVAGLAGAVAGGIGTVATGITEVTAAATRGIPVIGNFAAAFAQLGASGLALGPVLLILVSIIGVALAGAVALLTGAVVALGASFLAAAAGVGVLGVALAGAFGPVLLVAIAAMARFAKILEAVKAQEDAAATAAKDHADALRDQATAAEAVDDAVRGIAEAELSRDQARLNVKQAEQALADFRKEAGLTKTSLDDLFTKFTDVDYRPENLAGEIGKSALGRQEGVDPLALEQMILNVRSARQGEQAAIDGVSDAHDRLAEARRTEADALTEQNEKLADLTGKEQRLVDVLVTLKQTLTDVFRPATQRIFDGVIDFLEELSDFAKDARVRGGLTSIGAAIGGMFRAFGRVLRSRDTREAFGELARGGARLIRQLTPVFTGLFKLVTRVAQIALPWLIDVVGDVGRAIRNWAGDQKKSGIEDFVRRVRRSFNLWMGIAKELFLIVKEFFGDAKDSGDELAETIQKILRRFRRWLEENPDAIRNFFRDSKDFATGILDAIPGIVDGFRTIAGLAEDIRDVINTIQWPAKVAGEAVFGPGDEKGAQIPQKTVEANIRFAKQGHQWAIENLIAWGFDRQHLRRLGVRGFALGGLIRGLGSGDRVPILAEPGEFMLRRSVAQAIGTPRLNLLNTGRLGALGGGSSIHIDAINLPPAPGHGQLGDPRHQAIQLARELRRRGKGGLI